MRDSPRVVEAKMTGYELDPIKQNSVHAETNQFLTFSLGGEEYGVDILKVQEIRGYTSTTRIPNSPRDVIGVLNLRGAIVPIVALRGKFGLDAIEFDQFTAVIVVQIQNRVMGIVVDGVSEVMEIPASCIQPPPDYGDASMAMVNGIANLGDQLITILNIDAVLMDECGGLLTAA
jgi:purine-binding chemotaxis protein CheW